MKFINMFIARIPPPEPLLPNSNPNFYDGIYFDAYLLFHITVINDLTRNPLSLTQKLNN